MCTIDKHITRKSFLLLLSLIFPISMMGGGVIKFSSLGLEDGLIKDTLFQKEKLKIAVKNETEKCRYKIQDESLFIPAGTIIHLSANECETLSGVSFVYTIKDKKKHNLFSCDKGEFKNGIWKGDANTIELTCLDDCSISEIRASYNSDLWEAYAVGYWIYENHGTLDEDYDFVTDYCECDYHIDLYYDGQKSLHEGDIFLIDGVSEYPGWYDLQELDSWKEVWNLIEESSTNTDVPEEYYVYGGIEIKINSSFAEYNPKRTSHWFENKSCVLSGLEYLNTSEVVDMSYMFSNFSYFEKLSDYELIYLDYANKTFMDEDGKDENPNQSNIHKISKDDSDVWNYINEDKKEKFYSSVFKYFDFSKVQDMSYMFASCNMDRFELSSLHLPSIVNTTGIFQNCSLKVVTLTSDDIILNENFFNDIAENKPCVIDAPSDFNFNTDTDSDTFRWKGGWFKGFHLQPYVVEKVYKRRINGRDNLSRHDLNYVGTTLTFYYDKRIHVHEMESYDNSWVILSIGEDMGGYYHGNSASVSIKIHQLNENDPDPTWLGIDFPEAYYYTDEDVREVRFSIKIDESFADYKPKSTFRWFDFFKDPCNIKKIDSFEGLQFLDTSETTNMERMFYGLGIDKLDLSHLDLSKATNTSQMLSNCFKLNELSINSTMVSLAPSACVNIGNYTPCIIYAPEGFNFETDTSNDRFSWKSGNFILPNVEEKTKAYAILDNDTLTLYYDTKINERNGEVYDIKRNLVEWNDILDDFYYDYWGYGWDSATLINNIGYLSLLVDAYDYSHLVIDPSFANKPFGETIGWFANGYLNGYYDDWDYILPYQENISGLENIHSSSMFGMFSHCSDIEKIDLSKMDMSRTTNTDYMFNHCSSLSQIFLPPTCKLIGEYAFEYCSSLSTITIPNNVTYIGENAFKDCDNLSIVKMENPTPIKIYHSSFPGRSNTTLYVPTGSREAYLAADYWKDFKDIIEYSDVIDFADPLVKSICVTNWDTNKDGELEMSEAAAVTSLGTVFKKKNITSFNELRYFTGLKSINEGAFDSSKIQEVTLPVNVESLEKNAFLYCKSLVSLHIPAKVASMGMNALSGCTAMTCITVEENNDTYCSVNGVLLTKDKKQLLQFPCAKTSEYTVPEGTEVIGRDAFYQAKVTNVILPPTLKELVYNAFGDCKQLTDMEMPEGLETIDDHIFDGCSALKTIHIPSTVTSIGQYVCKNCKSITDVYTSIVNPSEINDNNFTDDVYASATLHVPAGTKMKYSSVGGWKNFAFIYAVPEPYLSISQDGKVATFYYDNLKDERSEMVLDLDGYEGLDAAAAEVVTKVVFDPSFAEVRPTSTYRWFYGMKKLASIEGIGNLNTSEVTTMQSMFNNCNSLTFLDLSHFDTSKVTKMQYMFYYCSSLTSLDLSKFSTSEVTSMRSMFNGSSSLVSVDVSGFNTSKVTSMEGMFHRCNSLTALDLSHFNTSNVTSTYLMFNKCSGLTTLDVSSFDMSKVTNSGSMFGSCSSLKALSISGSMDILDAKACNGVGTEVAPCRITAPEGFDFGDVNIYGTFQWKAGWFNLGIYSSCTLATNAVTLAPNGSANLVLSLANGDEKVSAFQFDLTLPEGVILAENGSSFAYTLAERCCGMRVRVVESQDGYYSLMAFYLNYDKFVEGTSGPIVTLSLKAEDGLSEGDLEGLVSNIVLTNLDYAILRVAPVTFPITISEYPIGDVNHDGDVNVADVMMTVGVILGQTVKDFHYENADVNNDGSINITDVMGIVDIVLYHRTNFSPALSTSDGITAVPATNGVDIRLDNASRYTALEMTVELPLGATLTRASLCKSTSHIVETRNLGGGLHRVVVYSLSGEPLAEGDVLLHFDIIGGGDVKISDMMLVNSFYEALAPQEATDVIDIAIGANDSPIYNIQGMKIFEEKLKAGQLAPGIYIKNGKKVVVN